MPEDAKPTPINVRTSPPENWSLRDDQAIKDTCIKAIQEGRPVLYGWLLQIPEGIFLDDMGMDPEHPANKGYVIQGNLFWNAPPNKPKRKRRPPGNE